MKTQPQTDNSNIVVESLDVAADKFADSDYVNNNFRDTPYSTHSEAFKAGSNWQKEQLLPLIDSLIHALKPFAFLSEQIPESKKGNVFGYNDANLSIENFRNAQSTIEKANNIIKTINT